MPAKCNGTVVDWPTEIGEDTARLSVLLKLARLQVMNEAMFIRNLWNAFVRVCYSCKTWDYFLFAHMIAMGDGDNLSSVSFLPPAKVNSWSAVSTNVHSARSVRETFCIMREVPL